MGSALTIGLVSGGLSALSTFGSSMAQGQQQRNQAAAMEAQASQTRAQAEVEAQKGAIEAETIDRQKSKIRREFEELQGRNRATLGAGNIDMTSGSALDVSQGNINSFAEDMGENHYQKFLKQWETDQNVKTMNWQADQYDANSSYLKRTADNFGTSLLKAALGGAATGLGSYVMAGGKFGGLFGGLTSKSNVANLANQTGTPVSQLTVPTSKGWLWSHPSGKGALVPYNIK